MKKRTKLGRIKQFFITLAAFLTLGISFKVMVLIEGLTEVRPVNALPVPAGLLFGPVGAAACGLGNLIADMAGTFSINSLAGALANFMAAYLPYRMWYNMGAEPNLHSGKNILLYLMVSLSAAFTAAWILVFGVWILQGIWLKSVYWYVFLNNFGFSACLGMPLLIILTSDEVRLTYCRGFRGGCFLSKSQIKAVCTLYLSLAVLLTVIILLGATPLNSLLLAGTPMPVLLGILLVLQLL